MSVNALEAAPERSIMNTFNGLTAVHFQQNDPGIRWEKDPRIAIDLDSPLDSLRILTPNVIRLNGGNYRMYYTGWGPARSVQESLGYIMSASSEDAKVWSKDPGVRVDVFPPHAASRTLCPDVIPLSDGRWRMYFEAGAVDRPSAVMSAVSGDGLQWLPESGVRFGDNRWSYGSPRCLYMKLPSGEIGYRLYFHRYTYPFRSGLDAGNVIISAVSHDGLHFEQEHGVRIDQEHERESYSVYAPDVIRLGDESYRMYYAAWAEEIRGGVFTATSQDGLKWDKMQEPLVDLGNEWDSHMVSEPCVIDLSDNGFRLFYEARDAEGDCRILSATSL